MQVKKGCSHSLELLCFSLLSGNRLFEKYKKSSVAKIHVHGVKVSNFQLPVEPVYVEGRE